MAAQACSVFTLMEEPKGKHGSWGKATRGLSVFEQFNRPLKEDKRRATGNPVESVSVKIGVNNLVAFSIP